MADTPNPAFFLGVQGPLARSATDLELMFDVLKGPDTGEDTAWRLDLPAPRHEQLKGFRVAVISSCGDVRPSTAMLTRLQELADFLRSEGAAVSDEAPPFDANDFMKSYTTLLMALVSLGQSDEERQQSSEALIATGDEIFIAQATGITLSAADYIALLAHRESFKTAWSAFFQNYDVVITPTALDVAFPHQTAPQQTRSLLVDNSEVPYFNNIFFPSLAIFTGLPATAFPAGLSADGLPLGLQAIGPYLEDRTTLKFAQLLEQSWHKFEAPPGY